MRTVFTLLLTILSVPAIYAQSADKISVRDVRAYLDGETVTVTFEAESARKAAPRGTTVAFVPYITDGQYKVSLRPVVVKGRGADIAWMRHEWAAGTTARYDDAVILTNGQKAEYTAEVPFQRWMHDARIEVETVTAGCCNSFIEHGLLIADILPMPEPESEPEIVVPEPSIAEQLAAAFPFVLPVSEFDPNEPIRFYDDERDNALTIYYHINSYDIDGNYAGNRQTLTNLVGAIEAIRISTDSEVAKVVIAGFASPEGNFDFNDKLAFERAVSIEEYILKNTGMPQDAMLVFNGSADWRGLRNAIAADPRVPAQLEALDIIDNHPIWNAKTQTGRQTMLRNLGGGRTYRYLADNIFPKLRNGAFIRVYYNNKD